jgi:uncharacterized protein (UPF0332 family)
LKRAETSFESAKVLLGLHDYDSAVNRAYYAMHSAALHLFATTGIPLPKTHHGTHTLLNKEFVQTGKLAARHASDLSKVENTRLAADYIGDGVSEEDAKISISKAEEFLKAIKEFLAKS